MRNEKRMHTRSARKLPTESALGGKRARVGHRDPRLGGAHPLPRPNAHRQHYALLRPDSHTDADLISAAISSSTETNPQFKFVTALLVLLEESDFDALIIGACQSVR